MKVKDQLRMRREQLGVTVHELADRLGVSAQAVRHWESGRSFPGKTKTGAIEEALSFTIDWTEGARAGSHRAQSGALIDPNDVALLLQIGRLPPPAKALIGDLIDMCLDMHGEPSPIERSHEAPAASFYEDRKKGDSESATRTSTRPQPSPRGAAQPEEGKRPSTRRKAA